MLADHYSDAFLNGFKSGMTDEERKKLCEALRQLLNPPVNCLRAADEIERLAAELDETRKKLTSAEIQRDDWKFERLI
jgi:hypothetical protein